MFGTGDMTDTGQCQYPNYGVGLSVAPYPMQSYNGLETSKPNRQAPSCDVDGYPWPIRRFTNMSVTDVQLINGMQRGILSGKRINYQGAGYLYAIMPQIPGQTRDNAAGFHKRGPSPYTVRNVFANGPGSQPENPGGPGKIAGPVFVNPMSG